MAINNFYIPDRQLILPGSFQRSSYLSEVLEDIGDGFLRIDSKLVIPSGASTTLTTSSARNVFITGNSLTHTINLPAGALSTYPPFRIFNLGIGNVITIDAGASKIMHGSQAGEITLRTPGDHITLQYLDSTVGWGIMGMRSRRIVAVSSTPTTVQLNRYQETMITNVGAYTVNVHFPSDKSTGDVCDIFLRWGGSTGGVNFGDGSESVQNVAGTYNWIGGSTNDNHVRAWWDGSTWNLSIFG